MPKVRRALAAAVLLLLVGPVVAGPSLFPGDLVSAHAQLVSSSPGAGDVVPTSPTEIRLVFSEPLEPERLTELLDEQSRAGRRSSNAAD